MPAIYLSPKVPRSSCVTTSDEEYSPPPSRRMSRLSVQLIRASVVRDNIREPFQSLQRLKNRAFKRNARSFETSPSGFINYSYANSSFCNSLIDLNSGRDSPHFGRTTLSLENAMQQHKMIEFRQRFLALPGEIRNQIYDFVISTDQGDRSHISHFHRPSGQFVYNENESGKPDRALNIRSAYPRPECLHYIREGDPIWQGLLDRWISDADVEMFQYYDLRVNNGDNHVRDSFNCLQRNSLGCSPSSSVEALDLIPSSRLDFFEHRWTRSITLNLSLYGVNYDFAEEAKQTSTASLHDMIAQVSQRLEHTIKTSDLRININLWPGEYMDNTDHGWTPFFEYDADVEGVWELLKPLKALPGMQSIRVKRLMGTALWSRQPNSLYPENPPLVVVERAGVSVDGWLDWDWGWRNDYDWDWGLLG